ncbi:MAG: phenylalanine--tRNA ligase subunit alpha [Candidatus Woesearchaeota archaeon]
MSIAKSLSPIEREFVKALFETKDLEKIKQKTGFEEVEIVRAITWLESKNLLEYKKSEEKSIEYTKLGMNYIKTGLPERILLNSLEKPKKVSEINLSTQEVNACIGLLKKHKLIEIRKEDELIISRTKKGEEFLNKKLESEQDFENKENIKTLQKRGLVEERKKAVFEITKSNVTKKLLEEIKEVEKNYLEKITPQILKEKSWKNKKFREYNIDSNLPTKNIGRKHFVTEAKEYIKNIWLELGFEEMKGKSIQSAFWDLDALFVPQDHPAREMQDTFYIDKKSSVPKKELEKVKDMHLGKYGKGWKHFDETISKKTLLRTHTTVLTALKLANIKKEDLPKKYFTIGKVYRNEALDWKHLFEFHQVEGIVIDEKANLVTLKSYLKEYFKKMGYSDVRIRPAYFPYTEPSMEVDAYHEEKKEWFEVGGAGIIRPEITKTLLGFEAKVLAWGLGMERIISSYYNITDIRELYQNNLKDIKNKKMFMR